MNTEHAITLARHVARRPGGDAERMLAEALLAEHEDCERLDAALVEALERAEQAERERDEARAQMQSLVAESLVPAEARVATLEAALRLAILRFMEIAEPWEDDDPDHTNPPGYEYAIDYSLAAAAEARAALGDQEAPTGPPCDHASSWRMHGECEHPSHAAPRLPGGAE